MNNSLFSFEYECFYVIGSTILLLIIVDGFVMLEEISYVELIAYSPSNKTKQVMIVYCNNYRCN